MFFLRVAEADTWACPACLRAPSPRRWGFSANPEGTRSVTLHGGLRIERPPLKKVKFMDTTKPENPIADDVLHLGSPSHLTPEEIAKAVAHHNRHHSGDQPEQAAAKVAGGNKPAGRKQGK